jgi:hypothetical protein
MRRALKIGIPVAAILAAVAAAALTWVYQASQHVPEFYRQAVALDAGHQEEARDQFVAETAALASDLNRRGRWQHLFTARQINAWLALELSTSYPRLLAGELHEPRVAIDEGEATIACRYESEGLSTILSLSVDAYLHEPNVLAIRIRKARAGSVPVPLGQVLDAISRAARELKLRLEWRKAQGDPVALITIPQPRDSHSRSFRLETVELRAGELYLAGTMAEGSERSNLVESEAPSGGDATDDQPRVGSAAKETRQE